MKRNIHLESSFLAVIAILLLTPPEFQPEFTLVICFKFLWFADKILYSMEETYVTVTRNPLLSSEVFKKTYYGIIHHIS